MSTSPAGFWLRPATKSYQSSLIQFLKPCFQEELPGGRCGRALAAATARDATSCCFLRTRASKIIHSCSRASSSVRFLLMAGRGTGTFSVDAGEVSGRGRGGGVTTSVEDGEADVVDSPGL